MRIGPAVRIAIRELRGGREALPVFVICLMLGVASLAGVATTLAAINEGLSRSGRDLLGGDIEVGLVHRFATAAEETFLEEIGTVSRVVNFRGTVAAADGADRAFAQVKGVDDLWPLYGAAALDPPIGLEAALAADPNGTSGVVLAPELASRLRLEVGDRVTLGNTPFEFRARLVSEPDRVDGGIQFGPRALARLTALREVGLLERGSLFYPGYRIRTVGAPNFDAIRTAAADAFPDAGWRWRDRRSGAPGVENFVERLGSFLSLVALCALALGGIGAGAAIRAYFQRKHRTIATLRALGAERRMIALTYLLQTAAVATAGVAAGLLIGVGLPLLLGPPLSGLLPVPAAFGLYPIPILLSAGAGYLTAILFALAPLASACETSAARVFRASGTILPPGISLPWATALAATAAGLLATAFLLSGDLLLTAWFAGGFAAAAGLLALIGRGIARLCRVLAPRLEGGPAALRRAVLQIGGSGGDASGIAVSLGLAIAILGAVALVSHSLRSEIDGIANENSPAFFVLDVPKDQVERVEQAARTVGSSKVEHAPMLRGFVTRLDGVPAAEAEVASDARWFLRGDRGLTYAAVPPADAELVAGSWWPTDYSGPPLVSFAAEEAGQLGLQVGSTVTVNVLGRPLTATIANLREVDYDGLGITFLMIFDPGSLSAAPHQQLATVYLPQAQGERFVRLLGECCPTATAVSVEEGVEVARSVLEKVAAATFWGSAVTLVTGLAVLAGVAAAGQRRQVYESAVLKALGATRREILAALALKWSLLGAAAALAALLLGAAGAWATLRFALESTFSFSLAVALLTTAAGALASIAAGLAFARRAVLASPATLLRGRE